MSKTFIYSIGIMTGTSCDGADAALVRSDGKSESLLNTFSKSFPASLRKKLRKAQLGSLPFPEVFEIEKEYSSWLAEFVVSFTKKIKSFSQIRNSLILSVHGQTVWHAPKSGISVQLLNAEILSYKTGLSVVYRFRQADLARHGQGAPLVPLYHSLLAKSHPKSFELPVSLHNIGGISNLTIVSKNTNNLVAFDTGPGNALIDLAIQKLTKGKDLFDRSGRVAAKEILNIDWKNIIKLSSLSYFRSKPPKSTGRELFNESFLKRFKSSGKLLVAETTAFTALTMAWAYRDFVLKKNPSLKTVYFCGGGANNKTLISLFQNFMNEIAPAVKIKSLDEKIAPAQFLEAMAFARFGIESILCRDIAIASVTGASQNSSQTTICMGENFQSLIKVLNKISKH